MNDVRCKVRTPKALFHPNELLLLDRSIFYPLPLFVDVALFCVFGIREDNVSVNGSRFCHGTGYTADRSWFLERQPRSCQKGELPYRTPIVLEIGVSFIPSRKRLIAKRSWDNRLNECTAELLPMIISPLVWTAKLTMTHAGCISELSR